MTDKKKLQRVRYWPMHPSEFQGLKSGEYPLTAGERPDWFGGVGNYNPGEAVSRFEQQCCQNLNNLYSLPGEEPPVYLALSITQEAGQPAMGKIMRPGTVEQH